MLKIVVETPLMTCIFRRIFFRPMRGDHWRKSTNGREGKPDRNFDAAFGTNFRISQSFIEANKLLYLMGPYIAVAI